MMENIIPQRNGVLKMSIIFNTTGQVRGSY